MTNYLCKILVVLCFFQISALGLAVDKSHFIKTIIEDPHKVLLIVRPNSWGKSSNLRAIENFLMINMLDNCEHNDIIHTHKLRKLPHKKISGHTEIIDNHFDQYPTIFISLRITNVKTIEELHTQLSNRIKKLYQKYIYVSNSPHLNVEEISIIKKYADDKSIFTKIELQESLRFLSNMMYKHFNREVLFLVDEYDAIVNNWYYEKYAEGNLHPEPDEVLLEIYDIVGPMIRHMIENNDGLYKAIIGGSTCIPEMHIFDGIKSFREDSILNPNFTQYFGFSKEEIIALLKKEKIWFDDTILANIQSWYGGYNVGGVEIYNPKAIMRMIRRYKQYKDLVLTHVRNIHLKANFKSEKRQKELAQLLDGEGINIIADPNVGLKDLHSTTDSFYTLLAYQGFLSVENIRKKNDGTYSCKVKIPNKEYKEVFERARI